MKVLWHFPHFFSKYECKYRTKIMMNEESKNSKPYGWPIKFLLCLDSKFVEDDPYIGQRISILWKQIGGYECYIHSFDPTEDLVFFIILFTV